MAEIFDIFSKASRDVLKNAALFAVNTNSSRIELEHLLFGIAQQQGSIGFEVLRDLKIPKIPLEKIKMASQKLGWAPLTRRAIERAALIAAIHEHPYVGTEHMLIGILEINDREIARIFSEQKISVHKIREKLQMVLKSNSKFPNISNALTSIPLRYDEFDHPRTVFAASKKHFLDIFAVELTDKKIQKNIDPVIGREGELERIIHILSRRIKNNPLLLGDSGVGKTAIVEGLAKKIISDDVPEALFGKKIYSLDLGLLIAGSSFRGEFETRIKHIIQEVKNDPNIILFIDEIHNIIGAGSAAGSLDAANILKPSLSRGEIRCIGASTPEEYKKYIENDSAFERRFQILYVQEPTAEKTFEILKGIKSYYETFHKVTIEDGALKASVKLASRYLQEKFFPDKAIDLIDEAASRLKINTKPTPSSDAIKELQKQFEEIIETKKKAVLMENYDAALIMRQKEEMVLSAIDRMKDNALKKEPGTLGAITEKDIKEIVAKITKIPFHILQAQDKENLLHLEEKISEKVIGQNTAVRAVAQSIRRAWAGIHRAQRPMGSFIFLGPSGVGKTELARVLAQTIFYDPHSFIRIDMSEYSESFNISKLIGSPAGYVGYKDATALTDRVRRKPYSLILFDEIEKAHPNIFNLFLQILEDGHITDASGKNVHFKNTIIVMTSNLGSEAFLAHTKIGFNERDKKAEKTFEDFENVRKHALERVQKFFRPEFLNRIDKIIVFDPLELHHLEKIALLQLQELAEVLREENITLCFEAPIAKRLAQISNHPSQGAREVRKNIAEHIENPLAEKLLEQEEDEQKSFLIALEDENIVIRAHQQEQKDEKS